ncbi:MAG: hypothetical protein H0V25_11040 [Solirubrobacterales bacterium]|nr:hypothetical protein [Solirubrobacterales bacterium]
MLIVLGSAVFLLAVVTLSEALDGSTMQDTLTQLTTDPRFASLNLTLDGARSLVRYTLMVVGVLSATSLVLGVFVLRRHEPSRIALTALGSGVAVISLLAGPPGWALVVYVAAGVGLLWTSAAREWFTSAASRKSGV